MLIEILTWLLMLGTGFLAGIVNTLAGGASIFTLSMLLFFGLDANVANGTNRLGILVQNGAGVRTFQKKGLLNIREGLRFVIPSLIGAILGALLAVDIDKEQLELVVGFLMTGVLFLVLFNPKKKRKIGSQTKKMNKWVNAILFFAIGFYGGFVQAGIGIVILVALLRGANYTLIKGNVVKMLIIVLYTIPVFCIFVWNGHVMWIYAILLALGQVLGTWFTSKHLVNHPKAGIWVRYVLISMIVISIIKSFRKVFFKFGDWFNELTVDINIWITQLNETITDDMRKWIVLAVMILLVIGLLKEIRPAIVFMLAIVIFVFTGILSPGDWLVGFSNEQIATIVLLIVITAAIRKNFNIEAFFDKVFRKARNGKSFLLRMCAYVAVLSAFMNNTPVVAFMTPYVYNWSKKFGIHPSKLLMPLSYATILGGMITVLGTSTNLVLNGFLIDKGLPPLEFTDFFYLGILVTIIGIAYLYTIGYKLLPENREAFDDFKEKAPEYTVETYVTAQSKFVGKSIGDSGLMSLKGAYLIELIRDGKVISPISPKENIVAHDTLLFIGKPDAIIELASNEDYGLRLPNHDGGDNSEVLEAVIPSNSLLAGQAASEEFFQKNYGAKVIAIHRNGEKLTGKMGQMKLAHGDLLLLSVDASFLKNMDSITDFYVLSRLEKSTSSNSKNINLFLGILAGIILLGLFKIIALFTALLYMMMAVLALRLFDFKEIKKTVDIDLIVLLVSALAIGKALISTGAADIVATGFVDLLLPIGKVAILIGLFVLTVTITSFVTNVAAISIMFPVAFALTQQLGLESGTPLYVAICFAASAAFITPVGYQTNWMVYGPGGYTNKDFFRVGSPLLLIYSVVCISFILLYYGF
ncbi:MAG: di/tricarboxylate transporter [Arenicella sp.]|jgi:di/tricarboxylate transporter